ADRRPGRRRVEHPAAAGDHVRLGADPRALCRLRLAGVRQAPAAGGAGRRLPGRRLRRVRRRPCADRAGREPPPHPPGGALHPPLPAAAADAGGAGRRTMTRPLRVGIAGLGTVGVGVLRMLAAHGDAIAGRVGRRIEVVAVSARNRGRDRGIDISPYRWVDDPVALARDEGIDVVVELMGGADGPARALAETALSAGRSVVTANKAMIAEHGNSIARLAEEKGAVLAYEAAVAGGIPIVKGLREGLRGHRTG